MFHAHVRRITTLAAIMILMIAISSCGRQSTSEDDGHDHGAEMLQATGWSTTHEVFIEYEHLLSGVSRMLSIFVTDLRTGEPFGAGGLTLRWSGEGEGDSFVRLIAASNEPGRFEVEAQVPTAGYWTLEVTPDGAETPVRLDSIHVAANHIEALHHHEEPDVAGGETILLTKERQWLLALSSVVVQQQTFTQQVHVAAMVQAPPERRVVVTTPLAGRLAVVADGALPALGDRVEAGQPLVAIQVPLTGDGSALAGAESDLVRTRQNLQLAEAELERARTLMAAEAASRRRVEEAESAVAAARAAYEAAQRLVAGDDGGPRRVLRAPIAGVVVDVVGGPGQFVDAGAAVVTVLDPSLVWVKGLIPETDLGRLSADPVARLASHGDANTVCEIDDARLVFLSPEIDPASRTAAVVYAVDNADGHLRVGQTLGLRLETSESVEGLVIPSVALVDEHSRPVVFVQVAGETFAKRHVTVAGDDGHHSLITAGLTEGERVVVGAAWAVKLAGADIAAPGHGHTH